MILLLVMKLVWYMMDGIRILFPLIKKRKKEGNFQNNLSKTNN
jgi:hypothetical protein